ncbi:UNVERIFIED_CONTAM: hypothetical protein Sindi_2893000 [Sesamum indicum]
MPVRYLGIPLEAQRLSVTKYSPLVDQIANCISKGWSAIGSKFFHVQRRSSRKSTDFAGIFYGTLGGHRSLGRKSAISRKVDSVFGTYSLGTWLYLLVYYGTSTARQIHCGCRGSMVSTLEMHQSGTDNRRRGILHSFNGLPKFATGWSLNLNRRRQLLNNDEMVYLKGLQTSKAYKYFRPKLARQPGKATIWKAFIPPKYSFILWLGLRGRLATRDRLGFLQEEDLCSLCINTKESTKHLFFECPFSNFVWSCIRHWFGINRTMSTLQVRSNARRRKQVPPCKIKRDTSLWHARCTHFEGIVTKSSSKAQRPVPRGLLF